MLAAKVHIPDFLTRTGGGVETHFSELETELNRRSSVGLVVHVVTLKGDMLFFLFTICKGKDYEYICKSYFIDYIKNFYFNSHLLLFCIEINYKKV